MTAVPARSLMPALLLAIMLTASSLLAPSEVARADPAVPVGAVPSPDAPDPAGTPSRTDQASQVTVAGRVVVVDPPLGYCRLSDDIAEEAIVINRLQKANAGYNELLMAFAECGELARHRDGKAGPLIAHGNMLVGLNGGRIQPVSGKTRAEFVAGIARDLPRFDGSTVRDEVNRVLQAASLGRLANLTQGLAAADPEVVYIASVSVIDLEGKRTPVASVTALTLLNQLLVSTNIYRPYEGQSTIDALLTEQRQATQAMIAANDALPAEVRVAGEPGTTAANTEMPVPAGETGGAATVGAAGNGAGLAVILVIAAMFGLGGWYFWRSRRP